MSIPMTWFLIPLLALISSCSSETVYKLTVKKTLNNGDPIDPPADFTLITEVDVTGQLHLRVVFDIEVPKGFKNIIASMIYFANAKKELTEVIFEEGQMRANKYSKPWNLAESETPQKSSIISPTSTDMIIPLSWLPAEVSVVSASIAAIDDNDQTVILNYYGIKNYPISLQDVYVVGNYKPYDFGSFTVV